MKECITIKLDQEEILKAISQYCVDRCKSFKAKSDINCEVRLFSTAKIDGSYVIQAEVGMVEEKSQP